MGGPTFPIFSAGFFEGFLVVIMCERTTFLLSARVHYNFMSGARDEGVDREGESKGCPLQRGESFSLGDYGTPQRALGLAKRDFIPPLSEGNKCRGTFDQPTDVSHRVASARRPRCDSDRRLCRKICISGDDNRALLSNYAKEN